MAVGEPGGDGSLHHPFEGREPARQAPLNNDEIDAFIRDTPDLVRFCELAAPLGDAKGGIGLMAGLYLIHEVAKPPSMMDFMNKVRTGVGFSDKRDAALALATVSSPERSRAAIR